MCLRLSSHQSNNKPTKMNRTVWLLLLRIVWGWSRKLNIWENWKQYFGLRRKGDQLENCSNTIDQSRRNAEETAGFDQLEGKGQSNHTYFRARQCCLELWGFQKPHHSPSRRVKGAYKN